MRLLTTSWRRASFALGTSDNSASIASIVRYAYVRNVVFLSEAFSVNERTLDASRHLVLQSKEMKWKCLGPVAGIFIGSAVGLSLSLFLQPSFLVDLAIRLFEIMFGVIGWALSTILVNQAKLHCGGTQRLDAPTRQRYNRWAMFMLPLLVLVVAFLVSRLWPLYFLSVALLTFCFLSEIVSGSPMKAAGTLLDY
jgi:hypothetical protein